MDAPEKGRWLDGMAALAVFLTLFAGYSSAKRAWILMNGKPVAATVENVTCSVRWVGCTVWFTYTGSDGKPTGGLTTGIRRSRSGVAQARYLPGHEKDLTTAAELVDDDGYSWIMPLLGAVFALYCFLKRRWRYQT
jgi:hypothetical protein